jgi:hypothetical protein
MCCICNEKDSIVFLEILQIWSNKQGFVPSDDSPNVGWYKKRSIRFKAAKLFTKNKSV